MKNWWYIVNRKNLSGKPILETGQLLFRYLTADEYFLKALTLSTGVPLFSTRVATVGKANALHTSMQKANSACWTIFNLR